MSKCNSITRIIPASFAWVVLLFSTGVFFAFPCRYLMSVYSIAIPVFQSIITFFVTVNFGLATFVNPGAIPKAASDEIKNVVSSPTYQDVEIRGVHVRLKWCVTCQFFRPPRCVHCGVCDTCIETFDHHCPWVNNCIGRRNYRYFFMFLLWLTIHMISILGLCALYMKDHLNNMKQLDTIMTLSIIGIIIILFIPIFGLTGFHIMLITQGLTTNEQVTGKFIDIRSPYNKGCLKNILYTLCNSPLPRYHAKSHIRSYQYEKYLKQPKAIERNEINRPDKQLYAMQYQFVGKSDCSLSKKNESYDCSQPQGTSLLNRGSLHLSLGETIYATKHPESSFKSKSSRALTPPVPTRFDYSRRSLPPHNKFHSATTPGYFIPAGNNSFPAHRDVRSDETGMFISGGPQQNSSAQEVERGPSSVVYSHNRFQVERYPYAATNSGGKGSDSCCLGNQTVDKLQELANRSMMGGQCTDMTVLEVFPKACSSFQTTPSKDLHDGQQLLVAQTPQPPLYLNNCVDCQQNVGAPPPHHHHHQCQTGDFARTPGNRPLSFVKAMEMSEGLEWSDDSVVQRFQNANSAGAMQYSSAMSTHYSVVNLDASSRMPEQKKSNKSEQEISYEISV